MKCDCRTLQTELASRICLEKSKSLPEELRRKASICPECRMYHKRLRRSLLTMQTTELKQKPEMPDSLWPAMASQLRVSRPQPMSRQTVDVVSRWLAGVSIAVASLVLLASPMVNQFFPLQDQSVQIPAVHKESSPAPTPYAELPANLIPAQFQPFQSPLSISRNAPAIPFASPLNSTWEAPSSLQEKPAIDFRKTVELETSPQE